MVKVFVPNLWGLLFLTFKNFEIWILKKLKIGTWEFAISKLNFSKLKTYKLKN